MIQYTLIYRTVFVVIYELNFLYFPVNQMTVLKYI